MSFKAGIFLYLLSAVIGLCPLVAAADREINVTVSWNTWNTNFDEKGMPGNLTCRGYYSEKVYFEGAEEAPFDEPYDVAADLDVFPLGTRLYVGSNIGWVKVVDICGACKGRKMIDVWCGRNEYMHHRDNIVTTAVVVPRVGANSAESRQTRKD